MTIDVRKLIGTASPFKQGGSIRVTLPKKLGRALSVGVGRVNDLEDVTLFFIETNRGTLMCTISDLARNADVREIILPVASH